MNPHETNEKIAQARAQFLGALDRTFSTADGQLVLAWLHATAATKQPCFIPGDRDPHAAAQRDGRKSLVWEIEANLELARAGDTAQRPKATGAPRSRRKGP